MNYPAYSIGEPRPIPDEDIQEYQRRWERGIRGKRGSSGEPSDWRYYVRLLEK